MVREPAAGAARRCVAGATAVAVLGALVARRWRLDSTRLFELEVDAETAAIRSRVLEAEAQATRHALANALTAVEGASLILDSDRLSASDRDAFRHILGLGLDRLRHFVGDDGGSPDGPFSLESVVKEVADDPRWCERIDVDVAPDVMATGSPRQTAETFRQVLMHVSRRTPTGPMPVRGERSSEWSVLWVEDRASAMSGRRRSVIDSKVRLPKGAGDIALHVASRLVRGQGGDLRIESRPGGGTSFGICLPAAGQDGEVVAG